MELSPFTGGTGARRGRAHPSPFYFFQEPHGKNLLIFVILFYLNEAKLPLSGMAYTLSSYSVYCHCSTYICCACFLCQDTLEWYRDNKQLLVQLPDNPLFQAAATAAEQPPFVF